jgi:sucrose-6-phosphate hydrolase SacC (GH32 family)
MKHMIYFCLVIFAILTACSPNTDKTLVSWVKLNDLRIEGGSILTIQSGEQFDGIIFGETESGKWIAGSENWKRSNTELGKVKAETDESIGSLIQMAIVYKGSEINIYRNGELYSTYESENIDLLNTEDNFVVFGVRHKGGDGFVSAEIEDARIYSSALTPDQLKSLKPNEPSDIEPYAWWDFEGDEIKEKTGRYLLNLHGQNAKLGNGRLVLGKWGFVFSLKEYVEETPKWPENPPDSWVTYHLAHPGPGTGFPGDPNPAYFYKGRYHLHYIYRSQYGFSYAHVSSTDMVHWKWHRTVLTPPITGHGMFSGTGFFTQDGTPAMIYHGEGSGRNMISYAMDDNLDQWTKPEPIIPLKENGEEPDFYNWDPDIWEIDNTYYSLSGGKDPKLMKSFDLKNWTYLGKLLHDKFPEDLGVAREEDISCANIFKIGNKWMLLCISHRIGCRYYLGDFINGKFLPDDHHMMNWKNTDWEDFSELVYFAPESMLSEDGRRVMWTWLITDVEPSAVQGLPRELELPEDGILRIKPLTELESLRYDGITLEDVTVSEDSDLRLDKVKGDAVELEVKFKAPLPKEFGLNMLGDENGNEELNITYGAEQKELHIGKIKPPFELRNGEGLTLRIFIDKNLVEVFANDRQAAAVSTSEIRKDPGISIFTKDDDLYVSSIKAWKMKSIYE